MAEKLMHNTMFLTLSLEKEKVKHLDIPSGLRSQGWIYALKNQYMPGIFKIGMTVNEHEIRAAQIS
ncbi:GIY-YIG nuclease family protein, partial [Enterobacter hormaechei subsp. steigerwaltii]|nr:GIY-YIG nuclease family protein [Enterobacter hormaechei subsp. steigerwaltii]